MVVDTNTPSLLIPALTQSQLQPTTSSPAAHVEVVAAAPASYTPRTPVGPVQHFNGTQRWVGQPCGINHPRDRIGGMNQVYSVLS